MIDRRTFLKGMTGILAAGVAPAIITTSGLLMPVKRILLRSDPWDLQWNPDDLAEIGSRLHRPLIINRIGPILLDSANGFEAGKTYQVIARSEAGRIMALTSFRCVAYCRLRIIAD